MKLQETIAQLNREIDARRKSLEELKKQLSQAKEADLKRIEKSVQYRVVKVEEAERGKLRALGAVVLVLESDSESLDAELLRHAEEYGTSDAAGPARHMRSLAYYYAGGRIWHEGGGYYVIETEKNDTWNDKGVEATVEEWEGVKAGKIPTRLKNGRLNIE